MPLKELSKSFLNSMESNFGIGQNHKRVGLALSGGFICCAAQIGVIEVLEENGIEVNLIAGASSGAAIAAAYANGTLPNLKKRLLAGRRRDYWSVIFEPTIPHHGFLKGEKNRKFFEEFVGDKEFKDLPKKLILAATDLRSMKEVFIEEGKLSKAIQACTTVPGMFVPVEWEGRMLVDGGNFNMIPSKPLYQRGADYVISVYVSRSPNHLTRLLSFLLKMLNWQKAIKEINGERKLNIFQMIWRTFITSASEIKYLYHDAYPFNVIIRPDLAKVKRWQVKSIQFCVEQGRVAALDALPQIKRDLGLL